MGNVAQGVCLMGSLWIANTGCAAVSRDAAPAKTPEPALTDATVIALSSLREHTARYDWFEFKPGVRKLILSGTPDSRHISVLWYGYEGKPGSVPMHYHAKTESIFVLDGAQSDAKSTYGKGSFYFNPPGSAHDVFDSAGLFLLSYAAPPDFAHTADIAPYEPLVVSADYRTLPLAQCSDGSFCYALPLVESGGMRSQFVKPKDATLALTANVLVVLEGACTVEGQTLAADTLVVRKSAEPGSYTIAAANEECLLYAMAFQ